MLHFFPLLLGERSRYLDELMKLKAQARAENSEFITWNDIQASVDHVNLVVQEEHESEWSASAPPDHVTVTRSVIPPSREHCP